MNELVKGLQEIQKDIEELSSREDGIPGDKFKDVMAVSFLIKIAC